MKQSITGCMARLAAERALHGGGFTLAFAGQASPEVRPCLDQDGFVISGVRLYAVALPGHEQREVLPDVGLPHEQRVAIVARRIHDYVDRLPEVGRLPQDAFLGAWVSDGLLVLDASRLFADLGEALAAGQEARQQAIYSFQSRRDIPVPAVRAEASALPASRPAALGWPSFPDLKPLGSLSRL